MASIKDTFSQGITEYTGRVLTDLLMYEDPIVDDTYALRASFEDGLVVDFLIRGSSSRVPGGCKRMTSTQVVDNLEECMFDSWPPKTGSVRFW